MNSEQTGITCFGSFYILEQFKALFKASKGITKRKNIEDIHDLRVATRRIRASITVFGDHLFDKKNKSWIQAIKNITRTYGETRDLDVQINFLKNFYKEIDENRYKPGIRRVLLRLQQHRKKLQEKVDAKAKDIKTDNQIDQLMKYLEKMRAGCPDNLTYTQALYLLAFENIHQFLDQFLFYEVYIPYPEKVHELHLMRIAAKRLRYTMEVFEPLYNAEIIPFLEITRDVQQSLGDIRDCDVWLEFLPKFISKEQQRTDSYYGNIRPFNRLISGIEYLIQNRKKMRDTLYRQFINKWKIWRREEIWLKLREMTFSATLIPRALQDDSTELTTIDLSQSETQKTDDTQNNNTLANES